MSGNENIKKFFLKGKRIKKRPARKPILKRIDAYREVLIISDEDKTTLENNIAAIFKQAKISFFSKRDEKVDQSSLGNYTYHSSDVNLTGKIKNDKLNNLLKIQFDLIVDLSKNEPLNVFFLEKLNHSFMIGEIGNEKVLLYDLIIKEELNDDDLFNNIKQQITLLSQNTND